MHCGDQHELAAYPDLSNEQLGQIIYQIIVTEDDDNKWRLEGGLLQQARAQGGNIQHAWSKGKLVGINPN